MIASGEPILAALTCSYIDFLVLLTLEESQDRSHREPRRCQIVTVDSIGVIGPKDLI